MHGVGRGHDEGFIVQNGVREALNLACVHVAEVAGDLNARVVGVGLLGGVGDVFVDKHGVDKNCRKLEKIILPQNLECIGERAYFGCSGLK